MKVWVVQGMTYRGEFELLGIFRNHKKADYFMNHNTYTCDYHKFYLQEWEVK